jgi:hypothetical protein
MNYYISFPWDRQLSQSTLNAVAGASDWRIPFETTHELAHALLLGPSSRHDLLDFSSPYETRISRQYTATVLDLLSGDDPKRHLWSFRDGKYALLPEANQALYEQYASLRR